VELGEVIRVDSGKTTEVTLTTGINLRVPTWAKAPYSWKLMEKSSGEKAAEYKETLAPQAVSPGEYVLLWHQTEHGSREIPLAEVSIEPDKLNEVELSTGINLVPAEWVSGGIDKWQLVSVEDPRKKFSFFGKLAPQLVPGGRYNLWILQAEHATNWSELGIIDILPRQLNEFALNTGITFIVPPDRKPPYRMVFAPKAQGANVELKGRWLPTLLQPGKYAITLREKEHGGADVKIVDELEVPAGSLVELEL
jgi:Ca-activated chloride channel family protein